MDKKQALKRLTSLEEEAKELRKIIETEDKYTLDDLKSYEDACKILEEDEEVNPSYSKQIKTIIKAANYIDNDYKIWKPDFSGSVYNYLPYFNKNKGPGFGFHGCDFWCSCVRCSLGFYFKERNTCELIAKRFLSLYNKWLEE